MARQILIVLLCVACRGASTPELHYFADMLDLEGGRIGPLCNTGRVVDAREEMDLSLPEEQRRIRQFRCSLEVQKGRFTGPLPFTLQGAAKPSWGPTCRIRIGPAPIWAPLPLDVVLAWFQDPVLAAKLRDAVGPVDYRRGYKISVTTEGFHIRMEQFASRGEVLGELLIDGCRRIPTDDRVFKVGDALVFRDQREPMPVRLAPVRTSRKPLPPDSKAPPLDTTRAARLLLRDTLTRAKRALWSNGLERDSNLIEAGTRLVGTFQEVAALSHLAPIVWREAAADLTSVIATSSAIGDALGRRGHTAFAGEMVAELARLETVADPEDWAAATATSQGQPLVPLSSLEYIELARLAMTAAARQAHGAAEVRFDKKRSRDDLIEAVEPLTLHLAAAVDASLALDGERIDALNEEVDALSKRMDRLAAFLSSPPEADWDASFASAFDTEDKLRVFVFGMGKIHRPYTARPDPEASATRLTPQERLWTSHPPNDRW